MASTKAQREKVVVESNSTTSEGCGCLSLVLGIVALWALICGVTVNGKHYGIHQCSCDKGVEVDTGR